MPFYCLSDIIICRRELYLYSKMIMIQLLYMHACIKLPFCIALRLHTFDSYNSVYHQDQLKLMFFYTNYVTVSRRAINAEMATPTQQLVHPLRAEPVSRLSIF